VHVLRVRQNKKRSHCLLLAHNDHAELSSAIQAILDQWQQRTQPLKDSLNCNIIPNIKGSIFNMVAALQLSQNPSLLTVYLMPVMEMDLL
jgi:hypothetical protein